MSRVGHRSVIVGHPNLDPIYGSGAMVVSCSDLKAKRKLIKKFNMPPAEKQM
jgi:hypothetical protein